MMRFFRVLAFFCGKIVKFPDVLPWGWCFEQNIDFEQNIVILIEIELKKELLADFLYKMKFIFKEINMEIIIKKGNKVHYTTKLLDETGKIMVWKV